MELEISVLVELRQLRHTEGFSSQPPWSVYQALCSLRICAKSMVLLRYILLGILKFGGFRHVNRYIAGSNAVFCLVELWLLRSINLLPS